MSSETVTIPRWAALELVSQRFLYAGATSAAWDELTRAAESEIPWHHARDLLTELRSTLQRHHWITAQVDQMQGYITDRLAALEIDARDPRVVYEFLVVVCLIREMARNGHKNGRIADDTEQEMAALCRAIGTVIAVLAPAEARQ